MKAINVGDNTADDFEAEAMLPATFPVDVRQGPRASPEKVN